MMADIDVFDVIKEDFEKGKELAEQGKHEEAIKHFDESLILGAEVYFSKAASLIELGRIEEAEDCANWAEELVEASIEDYLDEMPVSIEDVEDPPIVEPNHDYPTMF
jgi:tetratricopeptide (TPR) repeat protein